MVRRAVHPVLRFLRSLAPWGGDAEAPDEDLLARFAADRDPTAFAALMRRHGPMVLGVCARVLGDTPATEDAFQAAFIVLARRARSVSRPGLLANWLYGVAYRTALKARASAARRRALERQVSAVTVVDPLDELMRRDLRRTLDDELSRLPEKYRVPLVLCYLDGQTHEEAARCLGCPRKTVTTRLARACERLRVRLAQRGVALSSAALAVALSESAQAMPVALLETTIRAAAVGAVPAGVAALVKEVLTSMFISKLKRVAVLLLAVGVFGATAVALTHPAPADERPPEKKGKKPSAPAPVAPAEDAAQKELDALQGAWEGQSAEQDGKALPAEQVKKMRVSIKGNRMLMIPGGEWTPLAIKPDPAKRPKVLYVAPADKPKGNRQLAVEPVREKVVTVIYRLDKEADTLTLCFDATNGKAVPEDFVAKKGSGLMLMVLKHELRPPAPAPK
jgi:RNA polymerase sigma factor (sigma-70 family)